MNGTPYSTGHCGSQKRQRCAGYKLLGPKDLQQDTNTASESATQHSVPHLGIKRTQVRAFVAKLFGTLSWVLAPQNFSGLRASAFRTSLQNIQLDPTQLVEILDQIAGPCLPALAQIGHAGADISARMTNMCPWGYIDHPGYDVCTKVSNVSKGGQIGTCRSNQD